MSLDGHDKLCGYQKAMFHLCIYIINLSGTLASLALPNEVWNENFFSLSMSIGAMEKQLLHQVLRLTKSYMMSNFDMCPIIVKQTGCYGKKHRSKPHPFTIYTVLFIILTTPKLGHTLGYPMILCLCDRIILPLLSYR